MKFIYVDITISIIFALFLSWFVWKNRKNVSIEKIIPGLIYIIMYRARWGLRLMEKISDKYRELVKFVGYCFIGFSFFFMVYFLIFLIKIFYQLVFHPAKATLEAEGFALVLPFTNIPGIGFLYFTYFIIAIFVIAVMHEGAHGIMARAHQVPVKSSGIAILGLVLPIFPAAFVEPEEKKLARKKSVVQYSVLSAGPMINIIFALLMIWILPFSGDIYNFTQAPFENTISKDEGFSFKLVNETVPAAQAGLENRMIINGVNGERVETFQDFVQKMSFIRANTTLVLNTLESGNFSLITGSSPQNPEQGFVGIRLDKNQRRIRTGMESWGSFYYWLKGLIRVIVLLSLAVGFFNLLPLGIVDGGRMLKVFLETVVKDGKKARKAWALIALLVLLIILFGLYVRYFGNPFL